MKIPILIIGNILLAVLLIHLVACQNFTAADYARIAEIVRQATTPSGK